MIPLTEYFYKACYLVRIENFLKKPTINSAAFNLALNLMTGICNDILSRSEKQEYQFYTTYANWDFFCSERSPFVSNDR
jgi:hypothetical protein